MITNNDLLDLAGKHAQNVLVDLKLGSLMPTWVLVTAKNELMIIGTPWADDLEKENARIFMKRKMRELGAIAYSLMTEAWTVTREPGFEVEEEMDRPKYQPDRREVVMALASDGKETLYRQWLIQRNFKSEIFNLERQDWGIGPSYSWMADMLL